MVCDIHSIISILTGEAVLAYKTPSISKILQGESILKRKMTKAQPHSRSSRHHSADESQPSNVVKLSNRSYKRIEMIPRSLNQEEYISLLQDPMKSIVFATGPAGSGKTMFAVLAALKEFKEGKISKIIITRPAVGADDEKHGFLPGDLIQKLLPWVAPVMDIIKEYYSVEELKGMLENEVIELAPVAFLRGRTFKNAFVIADEMQNSTINSMKMVLSRIGENSKMVITGDLNQHDRQYAKDNGLKDFLERLASSDSDRIGVVNFNGNDIQRHPVVAEVLKMYKEI